MQKKEKEKAVIKMDCEVLEYLKEVMKEKFGKKKGAKHDYKRTKTISRHMFGD